MRMMSSREKAKMVSIIEFIVLGLGTIFFFFILVWSKSKRGDEELILLLDKMGWKVSERFNKDYRTRWPITNRREFLGDLNDIYNKRGLLLHESEEYITNILNEIDGSSYSENFILKIVKVLLSENKEPNYYWDNIRFSDKNIHDYLIRELSKEFKNRLKNEPGIIHEINTLGWNGFDYNTFNNDYKIYWSNEQRKLFRKHLLDIYNKRNIYIPSDDKELIEFESKLKESILSEPEIVILHINLLIEESLSKNQSYFGQLNKRNNEIAIKNILRELENELKNRKIPQPTTEPPIESELDLLLIKLNWTFPISFKEDFYENWSKEDRKEFLDDLLNIFEERKLDKIPSDDQNLIEFESKLNENTLPDYEIIILCINLLIGEPLSRKRSYIVQLEKISNQNEIGDVRNVLEYELINRKVLIPPYSKLEFILTQLKWFVSDSLRRDYSFSWSEKERENFLKDLNDIYTVRNNPLFISDENKKYIDKLFINIENKPIQEQKNIFMSVLKVILPRVPLALDAVQKSKKDTMKYLISDIKNAYQSRRDIPNHRKKLKSLMSRFLKTSNTKNYKDENEYRYHNPDQETLENVVHFWAITILGYNSYKNHESTQGTQVFVFLCTMFLLACLNLLLHYGILRNDFVNCLMWIFVQGTIIVIIIKHGITLFLFGAPVILILFPILCYTLYRSFILYYVVEFLFDPISNSPIDTGAPTNEAENSDIQNIPSMGNGIVSN